MRHGRRIREIRELAEAEAHRAEEEAEAAGEAAPPKPHTPKRPTRQSAYEVARNSTLSGLADSFGISPHDVLLHFLKRGGSPPAQHEPEVSPIVLAEQYAPEGWTGTTDALFERARYMLATALGKDPVLRHLVRQEALCPEPFCQAQRSHVNVFYINIVQKIMAQAAHSRRFGDTE